MDERQRLQKVDEALQLGLLDAGSHHPYGSGHPDFGIERLVNPEEDLFLAVPRFRKRSVPDCHQRSQDHEALIGLGTVIEPMIDRIARESINRTLVSIRTLYGAAHVMQTASTQ